MNRHYPETRNAGKASWQSTTFSRQMARIVIKNALRRKNKRTPSVAQVDELVSAKSLDVVNPKREYRAQSISRFP